MGSIALRHRILPYVNMLCRLWFIPIGIALMLTGCKPDQATPYAPYNTEEDRAFIEGKYRSFLTRWPSPYRSEMIPTSFGRTHVLVNGPEDGPPVILLHGAMANALMWKDVVAVVGQKHRTIAIDIVGQFGLSVPSRSGFSEDALIQWIDEIIDAYAIDKVTIVATSFGGWLAMKYAIASNARLEKVVLVATAPAPPRISLKFIVKAMKANSNPSEENVEALIAYMHGPDTKPNLEMVQFMTEALRRGKAVLPKPTSFRKNDFAGVAQPVLVLAGENDRIFKYDKVEKYSKKHFVDVKVIKVKEAGHFVFAEKPDQVNQAISAFLN